MVVLLVPVLMVDAARSAAVRLCDESIKEDVVEGPRRLKSCHFMFWCYCPGEDELKIVNCGEEQSMFEISSNL